MKVLLDECGTHYLIRDFVGHEVLTIEAAGFKGLKNGRLLQTAAGRYDVLVTVDQNLQYQTESKKLRARRHCAQVQAQHISAAQALDAVGAGNSGQDKTG